MDKEDIIQKLGTILEKMKVLEELKNCKILEDFQNLTERYKILCKEDEKLPSVVTSVEQSELAYRADERRNILGQLQECTILEEFNILVDKYEWSCIWERYQVKCVNQEEYYECEAHERAVRDYNQFVYEAEQRGIERGIDNVIKELVISGFSTEKIAECMDVPVSRVDRVRKDIE